MRIMGDFGRFIAVLAMGVTVSACVSAGTAGTATAASRAAGTGAAAAAATPAAATASPAAAAASPTATASPTASPSTPAVSPKAESGNPSGKAYVPPAARAVSTAGRHQTIGSGTPASCTSAKVVKAVAKGGVITFDCGPAPVTILMTATAKVVNTSHRVVLDGGGLVTLSGGGKRRILYLNTCDPKQKYTTTDCWQQEWPQLVVQNLTFTDAYSAVKETKTSDYGGGAIFDEGGQLKVVNSSFIDNACYRYGPDLGGAAVRALGMWTGSPVYITKDTFRGGRCSNGGALSSIDASWYITDGLFADNHATGYGENPAAGHTPGGGSGGALYTDGDSYTVLINGTVMRYGYGRGEGGAVFFVVDAGGGKLTIKDSTLHHNPTKGYQNLPGIFDIVDGTVTTPTVIHSTIN